MKAKRAERPRPEKKDLVAAGKRIHQEVRRAMSRKEGTALAQRILTAIEAE